MNFWTYITTNSTLPVQPGTTFKDHLLNLSFGAGAPGGVVPMFVSSLKVDQKPYETMIQVSQLVDEIKITNYKTTVRITEQQPEIGIVK